MVGALITVAILSPVHAAPAGMRYAAYAINSAIGFYIYKDAKTFLLKASTAFIGALMFFYGLDMMITGHGNNLAYQKGFYMYPKFWGYLIGIILFVLIGAYVQIKYMGEPDLGQETCDCEVREYKEKLLCSPPVEIIAVEPEKVVEYVHREPAVVIV